MKRIVFLAAGLMLLLAGSAWGQIKASGSTGLRYDHFGLDGDVDALPWKHEGGQFYQEFQTRLRAEPSETRRWELNMSGVANHSDYRQRERGLIPEWVNFRYEDGGAAVTHRVELGDQLARFSPLTLDRRLQAARIELQPVVAGEGIAHSLVWLSAREHTDWRTGLDTGNRFHGASWLMQDTGFGRYAINVVSQEAGAPPPGTDAHRLVTSLAASGTFSVWRLKDVSTEAELAHLQGRTVLGGPASARGLRVNFHGEDLSLPLEYALNYRRNGEGFAPLGTKVERDSRNLQFAAGVQLPFDMQMRGRYNRRLAHATTQQLLSEGYTLTLEVPQTFGWLAWMDQSWELARRNRENAWGTIDNRATEARWTIRAADGIGGTTHVALSWYDVDDSVAGAKGSVERRMALSHSRQLSLGGVAVSAAPGVDYRVRRGADEGSSLSPTLRMDASTGRHKVGVEVDYQALELGAAEQRDEFGVLLDYSYRVAAHTFGVEYEQLKRERKDARAAEAWRAGVFWRYKFDTQLSAGD